MFYDGGLGDEVVVDLVVVELEERNLVEDDVSLEEG